MEPEQQDLFQQAQQQPHVTPGSDHSSTHGSVSISVIVPTFNNADILSACLNALMTQDFPKDQYEIIVVDDGSTDQTPQMVKTFTDKTPIVRYLHQTNHGPASARNNGARNAKGNIIMFTDDDCVPEPNWITEMHRPFQDSNNEVAAVKGAYKTRQTSVIARFAQIEFEGRYRKMMTVEHIDFVDTYSAAFRRDVFLSLNGFDTRFSEANNEDVEFSYRMSANGHKMVFNPNAVVYHTHPDTLYKYLALKFGRAYWRMAVYRAFPEKMKSDSYTPQTLKLQIALSFLLAGGLGCILFYRLFGPEVVITGHRRWAIALSAVFVIFLLSALPFLAGILNSSMLNKVMALARAFLKKGFLRNILPAFKKAFKGTFIYTVCTAAGRLARKTIRLIIGTLRKIATSSPVKVFMKCLKEIAILSGVVLAALCRIAWRLLCLPWKSLKMICRGMPRLLRFIASCSICRAIRAAVNRIACTRIVMVPLSIVMLFLRGFVMGLGILWGLQSQRSTKGRFSQLIILIAGDVAGIFAACLAAYYTRHVFLAMVFNNHDVSLSAYAPYCPAVLALCLTVFFLSGLYRPYKGLSQINEFALLTKSIATVTLLLIVLQFLMWEQHSRLMVLLLFMYALLFVSVFRWLGRALVGSRSPREEANKTRVLIVGTQEIARVICRKLKTTASVDTTVVGFIDEKPEKTGATVDGHEILGSFSDISDVIDSYNIHEVFVALPMMPHEDIMELVDRNSRKHGVHFHVVSNLFDLITAEIDIAEHKNIPITYLKNENMELIHVLTKRVFDVVVSSLVILLTLPFWIVIMIAIRLETDGKAIFKQDRVGKDGRIFRIYKFRTMYSDTETFQYSPSRPDDQRITRVGRFLRKTSLDEFPQFLNVLKGEMSLVGPRPEMPFIVAKYKSWERQRLKVKPGITGLWQIMGRKELPLHESLEYDFYYIKNQSLLLDLTILIKTIPIILGGKGAY